MQRTGIPSRTFHIALVIDHPAQHFSAAFRTLADEPGVQAHVYYWSVPAQAHDPGFGRQVSWDIDLMAGYPWSVPDPGWTAARRARWLVRQLGTTRPDVVICYGWASPIARTAILCCELTRTRLVMYGDTTWQHASSGRHRTVRAVALRLLLRRCAGAVSTGTFNREFYIMYGMDPHRIWPGVCPADTEMYGTARAERHQLPSADDGELRIGFAGKLIPRKGADELVRAVALLPRTRAWSVTLVGDGPELPALRALATKLGVQDRIHFRGFANTTEMPKLLAGFDVLVAPSRRDMRTLVTIEAMAAGAAVIVSDATAVWGPGDLIEDGATGFVYRSGDPAMLAERLGRLLLDRSLLDRIQRNGAERAEGFGASAFARTIKDATRLCVSIAPGRGRRRPSR
jgi:glycosyltransferase involved in cell wall biosynthesis